MQLYYHEIDQNKGSRLICKIDVGIPVHERITSLNVCPYNRYIAVATELNDQLTNLIVFELKESRLIEFRDEMNFYNDTSFNR